MSATSLTDVVADEAAALYTDSLPSYHGTGNSNTEHASVNPHHRVAKAASSRVMAYFLNIRTRSASTSREARQSRRAARLPPALSDDQDGKRRCKAQRNKERKTDP